MYSLCGFVDYLSELNDVFMVPVFQKGSKFFIQRFNSSEKFIGYSRKDILTSTSPYNYISASAKLTESASGKIPVYAYRHNGTIVVNDTENMRKYFETIMSDITDNAALDEIQSFFRHTENYQEDDQAK